MDEKDFELLEVLDETRNITHAADKLYMTQSALSKRIKSMEQELGVEILLRSRQGIRFTPAGEKVLEHSRAALKQMEQLRRGLEHHFIVHLIDMVSGQDQYIFRIVTVYVFHILINSIRCTGIPFTSATFLIWLQNRNTTVITIQIPRNTNTDMRI